MAVHKKTESRHTGGYSLSCAVWKDRQQSLSFLHGEGPCLNRSMALTIPEKPGISLVRALETGVDRYLSFVASMLHRAWIFPSPARKPWKSVYKTLDYI